MVYKYTDVSKRARNSIEIQINKLIKKYGFKEVRLVINKLFQGRIEKEKLEKEILEREKQLIKLKNKLK